MTNIIYEVVDPDEGSFLYKEDSLATWSFGGFMAKLQYMQEVYTGHFKLSGDCGCGY